MVNKSDVESEFIVAIIGNSDIDTLAINYFGSNLSGSKANDWTFHQNIAYPFVDVFCRRKIETQSQIEFVVHMKLLTPRNFGTDGLLETTTPTRSEIARNHIEELSSLIVNELRDHLLSFGIDGNKSIEFGEVQCDTLEPIGENDLLEFIELSFTLKKCL